MTKPYSKPSVLRSTASIIRELPGKLRRYAGGLSAKKPHKVKAHPARFPVALPAFFMEFLTDPGDLVCDPFAGSNTTGEAAETLGRRWVSCDLDQENGLANSYVRGSAFRFPNARLEPVFDYVPTGTHSSAAEWAEGVKPKVKKAKLRVAAAAT